MKGKIILIYSPLVVLDNLWVSTCTLHCPIFFFFLFSVFFFFLASACCNTPAWKICPRRQRSVGGACKTLRNERFAPCAERSCKLRNRVKKKPFSTFLLGSLFFSYFSTKLGAFALRATARCVHRARVNPRKRWGTLSSDNFSFTYSLMYAPL